MPLRVARQDRRWKGSYGRSLVPEPVWCKERQHPWAAVLGVCARLQTPGLVWLSLEAWCAPSHASWTPWCANEPEHWQFSGEPALGLGEEPGFSPAACVVLCPLTTWTQRTGHPPRYPTCSHHTTVQEDRTRLANVSAQGPREHALFSSLTHIPVLLGCSWLCLVITLHK